MSSIYAYNRANVRLIAATFLLLALGACSTTGTRADSTAPYCATTQTLMCESFMTERRCQCSDSARVGRALTAFGPTTLVGRSSF